MKNIKSMIKAVAAAILRFFARIAVEFNSIFNKGRPSDNPAGKGTGNEARPRKRLVDGVDADRFTRLCVVLVVGFVTAIGAVLVAAAVNSGGREIPVEQQDVKKGADSLTLSIGGNIMPTRNMLDCALNDGGYNFNNYMSELSSAMSADISIAGLCGQIDVNGRNKGVCGFDDGMNYPDELAQAISETGINYVFGANHYAFANGYDGMCASISNLHTNSVGVIGLTNTDSRKLNASVVRMNGIGVGIAGYNCVDSTSYGALSNEQKTYIVQPGNDVDALADRATADIAKMRGNGAEFIVICINWGSAGSLEPSEFMKQSSRKIAEAGADIIIGYGALVTLDAEVLQYQNAGVDKECYVFYSLGVLLGDNSYSSRTLDSLSKIKKPSDSQKKQLNEEKRRVETVNKAMSRSMTVTFSVVRGKNGSVSVESAAYRPIYVVKNAVQGEENSHLKYMVVEASRYISAQQRPEIFSDDTQWQLCREAFTEICALADKTDGKLILADFANDAGQPDNDTDTKI